MTTNLDLKKQLKELIKNSESVKALPEKQRQVKIDAMLAATPEQMVELIAVFEEEQAEMTRITQDFLEHEEEITSFTKELKILQKTEEKAEMIVKEKKTLEEDQKKAEDLLKKLDEIL